MHGRTATTLAVAVTLLVAAPAHAADYSVTGFDDPANAQCVSTTCPSLRAAIAAANVDPKSPDTIKLGIGTYTLQQPTQLTLTTEMIITGVSARRTIIQGNGSTRVMGVSGGPVAIQQLTIQGGRDPGAAGNIYKTASSLSLVRVRVTDGRAPLGGGIENQNGPLTVTDSLIDHNLATASTQSFGGGIYNTQDPSGAGGNPGVLTVTNSTIAFNAVETPTGTALARAGAIFNATGGNTTKLEGATVAYNRVAGTRATGAGLYDATTAGNVGAISVSASIVAGNTIVGGPENNCTSAVGLQFVKPTASLEGPPGDCHFARADDPQLATALSNQGGYTDVLTIPATSPAKGLATTCPVLTDQRDAPRSAPCDVGAFEEGATAADIDPVQTPPVVQPQPSPTPTPTPTPAPPAPVFHKTVVIKPVSGKVKVKLKGSNKFVTLTSADDIPLGSTIDVKAGKLQLSSVPKVGATPQTATFYGGIFKVTQPGRTTDLKLTEAIASCARRGHASAAAKRKPKTRRLWGQGSGAFRTSGRYSAATVRGTKWLVQDSCSGTLTRVTQGVVSVRDNVRHKTIIVRAGHRYTAKRKR